jgi:hypothetical protein
MRATIAEMDGIESVRLFNDPRYKLIREKWCAAQFGLGYAYWVRPCSVLVNDTNKSIDADFFLLTDGREFPFQTAEIQDPTRRRGQEDKDLARGKVSYVYADPERDQIEGASWIRDTIKLKIEKRYANSHLLNVLLYANFLGRNIEFDRIHRETADLTSSFGSVWMITDTHICSFSGRDFLGVIKGWGKTPILPNLRRIE